MNTDELHNWYSTLPILKKLAFLALVSQHLTLHGRTFEIDLNGIEQVRAFKGLNELHHQLSGQQVSFGLSLPGYPDDVFFNILNEKAAAHGILVHLSQSLDYAQARNVWNT